MFLLRLLGGATLEDESGPLSGRVTQRRRLALLAVLAIEHPRPVTRDKLVAWLWPEHDTDRARHLLRDSLYLLRGALGDGVVRAVGDELRLDSQQLRCDLWDVEAALRQERFEDAVLLYGGPLLDGFHVADAPELERWLEAARARLVGAHGRALERLAAASAGAGEPATAVEWWRRRLEGDPLSARITLRLMETMDQAGDRAGAIRQGEVHAALMHRELGVGPDAEVEALATRLRASLKRVAGSLADGPTLRGAGTNGSRATRGGAAVAPISDLADAISAGGDDSNPRLESRAAAAPVRPREGRTDGGPPFSAPRAVVALLTALALLAVGAWKIARAPDSVSAPSRSERLLIAEVANHTGDSAIGDVIAQVLRHELARSPRLDVMGRARIEATLERMRIASNVPLSVDVAREVATREEIKIVVTGDARLVGQAVVVSAAVIDAASGDVIHGASETARDSTEIVAAVKRLSDGIRTGIGESLASIRVTEPMWSFTTSSLAALRKQRGEIEAWVRGDNLRGVELSEEAIALDPDFGHAHVALAGELEWAGLPRGRAVPGLVRAYQSRHRLTERERYAIEGHYHLTVSGDLARATYAFRNLLETRECLDGEPCWQSVVGATLELSGDLTAAERLLAHPALFVATPSQVVRVRVLHALGRNADASRLLAALSRHSPEHPGVLSLQVAMLADSGFFDDAHALASRIRRSSAMRNDLYLQAALDAIRGRHGEAVVHLRELRDQALALGEHAAAVEIAVAAGRLRLRASDSTGASEVDDRLVRQLDAVDVLSRPNLPLALLYAEAGRPDLARASLVRYEREVPSELRGPERPLLHRARAAVLHAEGSLASALREMREAARLPAARTGLFDDRGIRAGDHPALARIYEAMGATDSAISVYERYLATRSLERVATDAIELAAAHERLGILYERSGELSRAAAHTQRFTELWGDADAASQPRVSAARQRATTLAAATARHPALDH